MSSVSNKKLLDLKGQLATKFGEDAVMMASDIPIRPPVSSGSLALDFACGVGGFPSDRVIEIAGAEGTGKTTLALLTLKNFLDADKTRGALILDTEHKLESAWVEQLIGTERMARVILAWPNSAEEATNVYVKAVSSGQISIVIFDSIGGSPTVRRNEDATVAGFGGNSLAITEFARAAAGHSQRYHCLTIGINQVRADMSGYNRHMVPGGRGWLHACALRIQLKKVKGTVSEKLAGEEVQVGYQVVAKVVKSGISAPGRTAWYWFHNVPTAKYGFGVDTLDEIIRLSILTGVIERKGAWYNHPMLPGGKIMSQDRLTDHIRGEENLRALLSREIMEKLQTGQFNSEVAPVSDPDAPIDESIADRWTRLEEGTSD